MAGCGTDVIHNRITGQRDARRGHRRPRPGRRIGEPHRGNGIDGVYAEYLATVDVTDNRIARNGDDGMHLDGGAGPYGPWGPCATTGSCATAATACTPPMSGAGRIIHSNRTERNGDDGIDVDIGEFGNPITVRTNRAFFNTDLGIEADPGTIDGGGNHATRNGNPLQCLNIA